MITSTHSSVVRLEGLILRGYCFDEEKPYQMLSVDAYIDGQYQTRLLADNPGIEFNGKPLSCGWSWELNATWLNGEEHELDLIRVDTKQRLTGCPYRLGAEVFDTEFQIKDGQTLHGLIKSRGLRTQSPLIIIQVDGEMLITTFSCIQLQNNELLPGWRIEATLPPILNDGISHQVLVKLIQVERLLTQTILSYQAQYIGSLVRMDNELVSGWIYLKQAPHKPVKLDLLINGRIVVREMVANAWPKTAVKLTAEGDPLPCGFYFQLGAATLYETTREVVLRIAGTTTDVLGPPVLFTPYDIVINTLIQAQAALYNAHKDMVLVAGINSRSGAAHWVRYQILAPIIHTLRKARRIPANLQLELSQSIRLPHERIHDPIVDIIVPVYQGLKETLSCIRSIIDHTQPKFELIVINDGSPDTDLIKILRSWAGTNAFTFLENPKNLGFVATVNYGMRQHPNRDVVLINADTIVTTGWLERLRAAAISAPNIATASPFSNNATILSFPRPGEENPVPSESALTQLAQQCATINDGLVMDIPTAVGFCMYIKRDALVEVGDFDEGNFGRGYGEENDFCLRASALGWRHVAACDVFVAHHGAKSFQDKKSALITRNLRKLQNIYPDYSTTIDRFIAQDPLRKARNGLITSLLKTQNNSYLLFVTHDLGGGVKTHTDDLAQRLLSEGVSVLALSGDINNCWKIITYGLPYVLNYQGNDTYETMLADLQALNIWHIHYHHVLHLPYEIWALPENLNVQYDVTLHDYYTICPTINMIDETGQYCGDNRNSAICNRCLRLNNVEEMR